MIYVWFLEFYVSSTTLHTGYKYMSNHVHTDYTVQSWDMRENDEISQREKGYKKVVKTKDPGLHPIKAR